ncbi:MAG TPA: FecR family protein [Alphaproteobacteria bacterium]|nr:FecR family protein [Alphaproteobacteria bacterium]
MRRLRAPSLLLGTLLLGLLPAGAALAADPVATVLTLAGDCQRNGAKLAVGDAVAVGDTVQAGASCKIKLRLADGSVFAAGPGSRFTLGEFALDRAAAKRTVRITGASGYFRALVSKLSPDSRFEVSTATATAAVRSTDWYLLAEETRSAVGVLEGLVQLSAPDGRSVVIAGGEGAEVAVGQPPTLPEPWSTERFRNAAAAVGE